MPRTVIVNGATVRMLGGPTRARTTTAPLASRERLAGVPVPGAGPAATRLPPTGTLTPVTSAPVGAAPPVRSGPPISSAPVGPAVRVCFERATSVLHPDDLPPDVRRLLWYHLSSVDKIEVLEYARTAAAPWTTRDAATSLGLPERPVTIATIGLCQADLLRRHGDTYSRTARTTLVSAALDVLRRAYGSRPEQVLRAVERLAHGRSSP